MSQYVNNHYKQSQRRRCEWRQEWRETTSQTDFDGTSVQCPPANPQSQPRSMKVLYLLGLEIILKSYVPVLWYVRLNNNKQTSASTLELHLLPCHSLHMHLMAPHHHLRLCVMRVALLQNISAFRGSSLNALVLLPPLSLPRPPEGRPPPIQVRRQVSYLHRAAQAQPIFQEDGNRNVTNPSVPV